jgi:hypothetical protein
MKGSTYGRLYRYGGFVRKAREPPTPHRLALGRSLKHGAKRSVHCFVMVAVVLAIPRTARVLYVSRFDDPI